MVDWCHHYEKTLDGELNPLLRSRFFEGKQRHEKLRGVWAIVEAKRKHGIDPEDPGDTAAERIVLPAKALIAKLEEAEASGDVDDECMRRLTQHVHDRLHPSDEPPSAAPSESA